MGHTKGNNPLGTLEKCVQILTLFSDSPVLQVSEIAAKMKQPRSTAYRYVAALRANHLVEEADAGLG